MGANADLFHLTIGDSLKLSVSTMLTCKKTSFSWKFIAIYGPAHEEQKLEFLDELELLMTSWQGPLLIGGDFNLVRFTSDKSNGVINHRWSDPFNLCVDKWGLIELSASKKGLLGPTTKMSLFFPKLIESLFHLVGKQLFL